MKHKKLFVTLIVIFSFLVCLGTFIMIWFWGDSYKDFNDFTESVSIPGLDDNAVPQGITNYTTHVYDEEGNSTTEMQEYMFISAYMKEGPSRIYVTGTRTGYIGYVTMQNEDGTDYTGHCGGIATGSRRGNSNGVLWVTSGSTVYCAKRSSDAYVNIAEEVIAKAKLAKSPNQNNGEENSGTQNVIKFTASFKANCNASFCFYFDYDGDPTTYNISNDKFYVGEFYRPGNYETDKGHHVTTKNGTENKAFIYEYSLSSSSKYGLTEISASNIPSESKVPKIQYIYSIPDRIQGMARIADSTATGSTTQGKLVLSQSYGLPNSKLYYYDWNKIRTNNSASYKSLVKNVDADGKETPAELEYQGVVTSQGNRYYENPTVYFVDSSSLVREYSIPAMSEGLCASGDKVYVLFESASYKYKMFVRQQLKNVYYFIPRQ